MGFMGNSEAETMVFTMVLTIFNMVVSCKIKPVNLSNDWWKMMGSPLKWWFLPMKFTKQSGFDRENGSSAIESRDVSRDSTGNGGLIEDLLRAYWGLKGESGPKTTFRKATNFFWGVHRDVGWIPGISQPHQNAARIGEVGEQNHWDWDFIWFYGVLILTHKHVFMTNGFLFPQTWENQADVTWLIFSK